MRVHLKREVKAFCLDFMPVRKSLRELGAEFVGAKEQLDFFYRLPVTQNEDETQRLKLRIEDDKKQIIYHYDRKETEGGISQFQFWEMSDPLLKEILDTALGVRVTVRKRREVWRKENIIFNLDMVEGVGPIFEIEVLTTDGIESDSHVAECRRHLEVYLGPDVSGSNEDLVA